MSPPLPPQASPPPPPNVASLVEDAAQTSKKSRAASRIPGSVLSSLAHLATIVAFDEISQEIDTYSSKDLASIMNNKAEEHVSFLLKQSALPSAAYGIYNHPYIAQILDTYPIEKSAVIAKLSTDCNRQAREIKSSVQGMIAVAQRVVEGPDEVMGKDGKLLSGRTADQYKEQTRRRIWTQVMKRNLSDLKPDSVFDVDYLAFLVLGPVSWMTFQTKCLPILIPGDPSESEVKASSRANQRKSAKSGTLAAAEDKVSKLHSASRKAAAASVTSSETLVMTTMNVSRSIDQVVNISRLLLEDQGSNEILRTQARDSLSQVLALALKSTKSETKTKSTGTTPRRETPNSQLLTSAGDESDAVEVVDNGEQ